MSPTHTNIWTYTHFTWFVFVSKSVSSSRSSELHFRLWRLLFRQTTCLDVSSYHFWQSRKSTVYLCVKSGMIVRGCLTPLFPRCCGAQFAFFRNCNGVFLSFSDCCRRWIVGYHSPLSAINEPWTGLWTGPPCEQTARELAVSVTGLFMWCALPSEVRSLTIWWVEAVWKLRAVIAVVCADVCR